MHIILYDQGAPYDAGAVTRHLPVTGIAPTNSVELLESGIR